MVIPSTPGLPLFWRTRALAGIRNPSGERSFASTHPGGGVAPIAAAPITLLEPSRSTPSGHSARRMTASLLQRPDYPEWDWCDFDSNAENSLRTHREPSAMVLVATGTIHGDCGKSCAKRREDQHTRMFLNVN